MLKRRLLLASALALAGAPAAFAQGDWPTRPVKLIVNFPAGGPLDVLARSVAEVLQGQFKQPFVVENRAGAGGNIGADAVAKAAARRLHGAAGHRLDLHGQPAHLPEHAVQARRPAAAGDHELLRPAGRRAIRPTACSTLADLVAMGKAKGVTFSTAGSGSPGHLAAEMFTEATGMKITHVPYKGNAPAVTAVLSGEVNGGVLATPGMLPHVKAGKITPLAVTSRQRSQLAPEVPTVGRSRPAATGTGSALPRDGAGGHARAGLRPDCRMRWPMRWRGRSCAARLQSLDMHYEGQQGAAAAQASGGAVATATAR